MLPRSDNERVCRVGAGTPMGNVFRRYWLPVCILNQRAIIERAFDLESQPTESPKVLSKPARSLTGSKR